MTVFLFENFTKLRGLVWADRGIQKLIYIKISIDLETIIKI